MRSMYAGILNIEFETLPFEHHCYFSTGECICTYTHARAHTHTHAHASTLFKLQTAPILSWQHSGAEIMVCQDDRGEDRPELWVIRLMS